jgi:hypothetical protein
MVLLILFFFCKHREDLITFLDYQSPINQVSIGIGGFITLLYVVYVDLKLLDLIFNF